MSLSLSKRGIIQKCSNTHTKQTQEPGGSRGAHMSVPAGTARDTFPRWRVAIFANGIGPIIARLPCSFSLVVYVPSGRVLRLPRSPPVVSILRHRIVVAALPWPLPRRPIPTPLYAKLPPPRIRARPGRCLSLIGPDWPRSTAKGGDARGRAELVAAAAGAVV
jgi:hypothetical protein